MGAKNSTARPATPSSHKAKDPASTSDTKMLRESVFFTARPAPLPSHGAADPASASERASTSSPCGHYSARIRKLMEHMSESGVTDTDAEIETSRGHWTQVDEEYCTALATGAEEEWARSTLTERELYEENVEAMRKLQEDNPESGFFVIDEEGEVELGRKIAEGGQAAIHEVAPHHYQTDSAGYVWPVVRKVFKAGYRVSDLQKQWPLPLLHKFSPINGVCKGLWNPMLYGRLMGDGRFAFDMLRFWGDLRKLLDVRMQHNGNQCPPFMHANGNYDECCMLHMMGHIAQGMKAMHREGTIHRDLKASNLLLGTWSFPVQNIDPIRPMHDVVCIITDYECSIGLVGTEFWRAPEILEALEAIKKARKDGRDMEYVKAMWQSMQSLFTKKSDVYSFAMICYEILMGYIPFEDNEVQYRVTIDKVLRGERPKLPSHLRTWMKELLESCWDKDPSRRPTFEEIWNVFGGILESDVGCQSESEFFIFHN